MNNIFTSLFAITLDEKTKKALIVVCALFIIVLLIFGGIYAMISTYMKRESKKLDDYLYDLLKFRIIEKPSQFKTCVNYYEQRLLYNNSKWGFILLFLFTGLALLVALIFFNKDYDGIFLEGLKVFPKLHWVTLKDIKEAETGIQIVGFNWMPVSLIPSFDFSKLKDANLPLLYCSCLYYIITIFNMVVISRAVLGFIARKNRARVKIHEVFHKDLDKFDISQVEDQQKGA